MARPRDERLVITCEHGGNRVPRNYASVLRPLRAMLKTHRGFDPGALRLALDLAAATGAPLDASTTTRLLVDLNRSIDHPDVFGPTTRDMPELERKRIIADHYQPYRSAVERRIADLVRAGHPVMHISVHSFTPVLRGRTRKADIGLLYDPSRKRESAFVDAWAAALGLVNDAARVRRNYPYKGTSDGFTTYLRTLHADARYAGIELEVNQQLVRRGGAAWLRSRASIVTALLLAIAGTASLGAPANARG